MNYKAISTRQTCILLCGDSQSSTFIFIKSAAHWALTGLASARQAETIPFVQ